VAIARLIVRRRPRVQAGSGVWLFTRDRVATVALGYLAVVILAAILAPWLTPYAAQGQGVPDPSIPMIGPNVQHPFGTDNLGRDELARVMFGARTALLMAFIVVAVGVAIGSLLGTVAGFVGGWVDEAIMRFTDVVLSFPALLLAIILAVTLRPSFQTAIVAIAATWWPWYVRIVRAETVSIRERPYVLAARSMGASAPRIMWDHVLPNVLGPVRVQAALDLGAAILAGASLGFLGLGPQPPTADWGVMASDGRASLLSGGWWLSVFPGLAIFTTIVALNLVGDGFHAVLDPRARES
jgi:peptide/nickel transport system permease protein